MKPKLVACVSKWRLDWQHERDRIFRMNALSVEDRLREQLVIAQRELLEAKAELESTKGGFASAEDQRQAELEERLEREREKRIEHTKEMAVRRFAKRELARGWNGWAVPYLEKKRTMRLLQAAAAKMLRPKLVAGFVKWRDDYYEEQQKAQSRRMGSQLSREMREGREAREELEIVRAELEELRTAVAEGRGMEEMLTKQMEESLAAEKEKRMEHIRQSAMRRIANRELSACWNKWHGDWAEQRRAERLLKGAAAKLIKPKLLACVAHWRRDWDEERQAQKHLTWSERFKNQAKVVHRLEAQLQEANDNVESLRRAALDGRGLEEELKRQADERVEREREKRIEHTKEMAARRIAKRDLSMGFQGWAGPYLEKKATMRKLQAAVVKMTKPKLVRGFQRWAKLSAAMKHAKSNLGVQERLAEEQKQRVQLEIKLNKVTREFEDQRKLDEVTLAESRKTVAEMQQQMAEMHLAVHTEKGSTSVAKANEETAKRAVEDAQRQAKQAQEQLAEQRRQAEEYLKKQLEETRASLSGQLSNAQSTIAELKAEIAQLQIEKTRLINEKPKPASPKPVEEKPKDPPKEKKDRKTGGILGNVDFDEDRPLGEQLREALSKNAVRILDLFREWDADGDGEISKKEFRKAMPKLGFEVPLNVIDELFDSADPDGSGVIDLKELQKMLRGSPPPPPKGMAALKGATKMMALKKS